LDIPKDTLLLLENTTVPDVFAVWVPAAITFAGSFEYEAEAVTIELFCMPKETLFEFEKTMVPDVLPV
jgi:hypothetical protein